MKSIFDSKKKETFKNWCDVIIIVKLRMEVLA